jgi:uncharacterized protein (TIGR02246 family)
MQPRTPQECDELFAAHLNAGDLDALLSLYDPRGSLVQRDGTVATGHAAIRQALSGLVAMRPRITVNVVRVVTAGDDLAMVSNDWSLSAKTADGQAIEATGQAIEVVRRQPDGSWRVVLDDPYARG